MTHRASFRIYATCIGTLLGTGGCARESVPQVAPWPEPMIVGPAPTSLPARVPSPFDPKAGAPPRIASNPEVPVWAGEKAQPFAEAVQRAAYYYQLPTELLYAVILTESRFNSDARSPVGASGLMQLMPRTAHALGVRDPFNAEQSIFGGARYLRRLANRFDGDLRLMLAGYNAGPGAVRKHGGIPPYPETRKYVRKVLGYYFLPPTDPA